MAYRKAARNSHTHSFTADCLLEKRHIAEHCGAKVPVLERRRITDDADNAFLDSRYRVIHHHMISLGVTVLWSCAIMPNVVQE